jgi:hypothetical protein
VSFGEDILNVDEQKTMLVMFWRRSQLLDRGYEIVVDQIHKIV